MNLLRFADPWYLLLLLVVPALVYWYVARGRRQTATLRYSSLATVRRAAHRRHRRPSKVKYQLYYIEDHMDDQILLLKMGP